MAIKQREMETRKKLLENPVKLKEIHRLLRNDTDLDGKSKRGGKDKKTLKKKKKDKKSKKSSKNEANDLDDILAKKYRKIRKETMDDQDDGNLDIDKFLALKYHQLSNELDKMSGKSKKKQSKDNTEKNERVRDRQPYDERDRGTAYRDRDRNTKMDKKSRNYVDNNRYQRNHSRSPDHNRRDRKYSPMKRNHRSTSVSASQGNSHIRQRDERFDRERNPRSPSHDRVGRNRRHQSQDRNDGNRRPPSKERDRRNRRQLSQDRDRQARRSRSENEKGRRRRSPSKDRVRRSRSRSQSRNTRAKYEDSTTRRKSRSKSRHDEKIEQSTRITAEAAKSTRSSSSSSTSTSSSSSSSDASVNQEHPKMIYGLVSADGKKIEIKNKYQPIEKKGSDTTTTKKMNQAKPKRVTLTEEEKERKLMEMQENAKLRVIECQQIMERNKKEKLAEEAQLSQTFDKDYVNKEMRKAIANQFSVESRIKSNINHIQRSGRTMEANFAKR